MRRLASADPKITHVSDTALWVAALRAQEMQCPEPAFYDPLASILAGPRGYAIANAMPRAQMVAWSTSIRTSAIDRLLQVALARGAHTVLNLGAGMDARPYRLQLPASLRWIEIDFPSVIKSKNALLAEYTPNCRLERVGLDLLDRRLRDAFLASQASQSTNTLVITEGVLPYFTALDAADLARALHATLPIHCWIQDFDAAGNGGLPRGWAARFDAAPLLFDAKDWFAFFEGCGWRPASLITSVEESQRLNRPYPIDFPFGLILRALPRALSRKILSLSGAVMMHKVELTVGRRSRN